MAIVAWFNLGQYINNVFEVEKVKTTGYNIASGYNYVWLDNLRETIIDGKSYFTSFFSVSGGKDDMLNVISYPGEDNMSNFFTQDNGSIIIPSSDKKPTVNTFDYSKNATGWVFKGYKVNGNSLNKSVSSDFKVIERRQGVLLFLGVPTFDNFPESYGWCYYGPSDTNDNVYEAYAFVASRNFWESGILAAFGNVTPGGAIGGYGTYNDTSDNFPIPPNRLNDVYSSILSNTAGKIQMYTLDSAAYSAFLGKIYTSDFWEYWRNTVFNPIDGIYSCIRVPFNELELTRSAVAKINVSNTELEILAGAYRVTNNFVKDQVIISNYAIEEYFGSFLDYSPYTTCELYIPFYGTVNIDINEIMGGNISITRRNNYVNGDFVVFVQCTNRFGVAVTHAYAGNAAMTLPITAGNDGSPNRILDLVQGVANLAMGNYVGAGTSAVNALTEKGTTSTVQKLSGSSGWNASHDFALIFRRVCQSNPENYTKENGRQADEFVKFSDLQGYTEVSAVDLKFTNGKITSAEIDEINNLLKQGVFF